MQPWIAGSVIAFLMCFTLTCYFFRIPENLRVHGRAGSDVIAQYARARPSSHYTDIGKQLLLSCAPHLGMSSRSSSPSSKVSFNALL
eukprot:2267709-Amphidinium_carterae.1